HAVGWTTCAVTGTSTPWRLAASGACLHPAIMIRARPATVPAAIRPNMEDPAFCLTGECRARRAKTVCAKRLPPRQGSGVVAGTLYVQGCRVPVSACVAVCRHATGHGASGRPRTRLEPGATRLSGQAGQPVVVRAFVDIGEQRGGEITF